MGQIWETKGAILLGNMKIKIVIINPIDHFVYFLLSDEVLVHVELGQNAANTNSTSQANLEDTDSEEVNIEHRYLNGF